MSSELNILVDNEYLRTYIMYVMQLRLSKANKPKIWYDLTEENPVKYLPPPILLGIISRKLKGAPNEIDEDYLPLVERLIIELHQTVEVLQDELSEDEEEIWFDTRGIAAEIRSFLQTYSSRKDRKFFKAILELSKQLDIVATMIRFSTTPVIIKEVGEWLLK